MNGGYRWRKGRIRRGDVGNDNGNQEKYHGERSQEEDEVKGIMVGKVRQGEEKKVRQGEVKNSGNVRGREQRNGRMGKYRVEGTMTIIGGF